MIITTRQAATIAQGAAVEILNLTLKKGEWLAVGDEAFIRIKEVNDQGSRFNIVVTAPRECRVLREGKRDKDREEGVDDGRQWPDDGPRFAPRTIASGLLRGRVPGR
jgi:sRNA-binding carbon storage regulator CsrA